MANKTVGNNIRFLRQEANWSQKTIALRLGISVPAVSKIERGVTDVNLSRLEQIANVFGVSVMKLLLPVVDVFEMKLPKPGAAPSRLKEDHVEIENLQKKVIMLYEELTRKEQIVVG